MRQNHFSPELERELLLSMQAYAVSFGALEPAGRLQAVTDRVCRDAHEIGMTPERMVIGLKQVYANMSRRSLQMDEQLRIAYDLLLSGCIQAYYAAVKSSPPRMP